MECACTSPFLLFPPFLFLLLLISTFTKQHIPIITRTTTQTSFSSQPFILNQERNTTQVTLTPNISSTSSSTSSTTYNAKSKTFSATNVPRIIVRMTELQFDQNSSVVGLVSVFTVSTDFVDVFTFQEKTSLDRIEYGLAKARAAIQLAVQTRNYTSPKEENFIPRGSIYRNPYAFHQSHIEMEKRFRVWAYKEGEPPLAHDGPLHSMYSMEGQFMDELESGKNPLMAKHPDEAFAFYIPLSVKNVVWYVLRPEKTFKRHMLQLIVEDYIGVVAKKYPYWNRSRGADHFLVSCHDWAPDIVDAHPKLFQHFIRVLCNANITEGFQAKRDVSLPEINLPFGRLAAPNLAKPLSKRTILAFFSGGAHGNIRKMLFLHWKDKDNEVQVYDSLPKSLNYTAQMGQSKYCLCPSGYEVASPRVVEAIQAGCVPVLISLDYVPPFSDVLEWSKFSVQIPVEQIPDIKTILQGIPTVKFLNLQKNVMRVRKHFIVNRPAKRFDVMYMVLHSVWLRRLNIRFAPL